MAQAETAARTPKQPPTCQRRSAGPVLLPLRSWVCCASCSPPASVISNLAAAWTAGAGPAAKVLPISPYLMFINLTDASLCCSFSAFGSPDAKAQGPRETPGREALSSGWPFSASSQSILPRASCQIDMLITMPRSRAPPMDFSPPYLLNTPVPLSLEVSKAPISAVQTDSVRELPASCPRALAFEFLMILPSCSHIRRISDSSPVSVPSFVMNCVTTVIGLVVSTLKLAPFP
mmetsp:Transcript_31644/g.94242  ORF Transcript_31644/g.94242 Transcript_31644/m.94242 type:complete len:233 (-) Transcript_31644:914-1612(-)